MATLHIRNVPNELYERLRAHAHRRSRSINQDVIEILRSADELESQRTIDGFLQESRESRAKHALPADTVSTAELIRADRASH